MIARMSPSKATQQQAGLFCADFQLQKAWGQMRRGRRGFHRKKKNTKKPLFQKLWKKIKALHKEAARKKAAVDIRTVLGKTEPSPF